MSKMQREKGRKGQCSFKNLLLDKDWVVDSIACGLKNEDLVAYPPGYSEGFSIEVKHHELIDLKKFLTQAKEQAKKQNRPWMLAIRLPLFPGRWLVLRKDEEPCIWIDHKNH